MKTVVANFVTFRASRELQLRPSRLIRPRERIGRREQVTDRAESLALEAEAVKANPGAREFGNDVFGGACVLSSANGSQADQRERGQLDARAKVQVNASKIVVAEVALKDGDKRQVGRERPEFNEVLDGQPLMLRDRAARLLQLVFFAHPILRAAPNDAADSFDYPAHLAHELRGGQFSQPPNLSS